MLSRDLGWAVPVLEISKLEEPFFTAGLRSSQCEDASENGRWILAYFRELWLNFWQDPQYHF